MAERINKALALLGFGSRRACEDLVRAGKVLVNGTVVQNLATRVDLGSETISVKGKRARSVHTQKYYFMLNKPKGFVCSARDEKGRRTIYDLMKGACPDRLMSAGRLDINSEGLIVLTNDGDFIHKITHPSYTIEKKYSVIVKPSCSPEQIERLKKGIVIDKAHWVKAKITNVHQMENRMSIDVSICEGRNREIRKMFETIGIHVVGLQRVSIGSLTLRKLPLGQWRKLTAHEVEGLL